MFSQLPADSVTAVLLVVMLRIPVAGVMLVELLGAIRPFKFMAFAGNAGQSDSHDKQG
jgi:hypothetical protein